MREPEGANRHPTRPLVPFIILGALGILILSWVIFMGYYIAEERHKQHLQQPAPIPVSTNVTR